MARDQGITRAGNKHVRRLMVQPGSFWEPRARRAPRVRLHSKQFWVCGVTPPPRIEGAEEPRVLCHGSRQHRSDAPDSHVWMSGRRRIFERQTSRPVAFASPAVGRVARAGDSAELYLCSPDNTSDPEGLTTQRLIEGVPGWHRPQAPRHGAPRRRARGTDRSARSGSLARSSTRSHDRLIVDS